MRRIVIAALKPLPGRDADLLGLIKRHNPLLRSLGLVTDRPVVIARSEDGVYLEIFEWASSAAIEAAHVHEEVQKHWQETEAACEYIALDKIEACRHPFPEFVPVD